MTEPRVEACYPILPKIELFARGKARPKWDTWERKPSERVLLAPIAPGAAATEHPGLRTHFASCVRPSRGIGGAPPGRGGRGARREGDRGAAATVTTPVERERKAIRARSSKERWPVLVSTRGPVLPLSRLESRLMCPGLLKSRYDGRGRTADQQAGE